ncbi:2-acylglycerol O-acyltransferase 1-like [Etheostoma cragini]|uniref:2-acylglycerol O-acyltransferase 1-like n=1 Tax=Etheostoma cragini TaxID=417921 RepID=UPI00155F300B|nr:2-acylglycerol O-acyltransferase 1-like [Etheostoma cragini]
MAAVLYAGWLWLDGDTPNSGGRRSQWVRSWTIWSHYRDYFPITLVKTVDLDPNKNYIFGFHPHGVLVAGAFGNFCTEATGFSRLFPGLRSHLLMLPFWFRVPLFRDYIMLGGVVSSCKSSLSLSDLSELSVSQAWCPAVEDGLVQTEGSWREVRGQTGMVWSGGGGAGLRVRQPEDRLAERQTVFVVVVSSQNRLQSIMGVAMPLFHARGVFQYSFGLMPYRKPIHTIVGSPVPVVQTPSPSNEDIERLHEVYLQSLTELFETHKHRYGLQEHQHLSFT